ncbi:MAG: ABC transporter ATP-binding protein [Anaerolineales bacterium]
MNSFVQIKDLKKQYDPPDGTYAVGKDGGVTFDIREGEIFSLLGPNGAGKTTTISMMSTLLTPTEGDIIIGGHSVRAQPLEAKKMIGVVPQEIALYPTLSARQNLEFFGRLYGLRGSELKKRTDEVLDFIGLTDRAGDKVEEYSGGMKRRVNIGVGLMHRPKMVFLDEPTVGIDPQSRRRILDTVKMLNEEQNMTVLYTTHYMEEAQELSDRIGIIDHGQIIAIGTQQELTQQVGQKDTLIFQVPEATDELIQRLTSIQGIESATLQGEEEVHIIAENGRRLMPKVINVIENAGYLMNSVEVREPNLEAVFLHMTGRALRD